jgi:hypothetical protein
VHTLGVVALLCALVAVLKKHLQTRVAQQSQGSHTQQDGGGPTVVRPQAKQGEHSWRIGTHGGMSSGQAPDWVRMNCLILLDLTI